MYSARAVLTLYEDGRGSRKEKGEGDMKGKGILKENVKGAGEKRTRRIVRTGRMTEGD